MMPNIYSYYVLLAISSISQNLLISDSSQKQVLEFSFENPLKNLIFITSEGKDLELTEKNLRLEDSDHYQNPEAGRSDNFIFSAFIFFILTTMFEFFLLEYVIFL